MTTIADHPLVRFGIVNPSRLVNLADPTTYTEDSLIAALTDASDGIVIGLYDDGGQTIIRGKDRLAAIGASNQAQPVYMVALKLANVGQAEAIAAALNLIDQGKTEKLSGQISNLLRHLARPN